MSMSYHGILRYTLPALALALSMAAAGPVRAVGPQEEPAAAEGSVAAPGDAVEEVASEPTGIDQQVATMSKQRERSIKEYERTIERLMAEYGVYDDRLAEQLLGMGLTQTRQGDHLGAIDSFEQSLHLDKVNNGLHHLQQAALIELLIDANGALENWERVDGYHQYLYWLHLRAHGEGDPRLIPVLERLGRWHLRAADLDTASAPLAHLHRAAAAFEQAVQIGEHAYGIHDPRLLGPLYGFALGSYYVAVASQSAHAGSFGVRGGYDAGLARAEMVARGYRQGRTALHRMAEIHGANPETAPEARGVVLTLLADWYLLFNRQQSARLAYEEAYSSLVVSGVEHQTIQQFFSRPRALPALRFPVESEAEKPTPAQDNQPRTYALASFDVTSSGRPRNIQIIESQPAGDTALRRRARRAIRSMRFRPRMENGKAVASAAVNMRYVVVN